MKLRKKMISNKGNPHSELSSIQIPPKIKKLFMIPLIIAVAIIPLIVRLKEYSSGLSGFAWFSTADNQVDFFLYYKQMFFVVLCCFMAVIIAFRAYMDRKSIKFTPILIPLFGYAILALLSTIVSDYSSFGYNGIYEQFESVFVLLGYCLVVYYAYLFIDSEQDVKLIIVFLMISIFILGLLGISQATGHDFFAMDKVFKFLLPNEYKENADMFSFAFEKNRVYLTLYNPNYVGVYVALIAPIILCLMLTTKKLISIILYLLALGLLIISLYGSRSVSGVVGIIVSLFFLIILLRRYLIKRLWLILPFFVISLILVSIVGDVNITNLNKLKDLIKFEKVEQNLNDIKIDDEILITYKKNDLHIGYNRIDNNTVGFYFTDEADTGIEYNFNQDTNIYNLTDERFAGIIIEPVLVDDMLSAKITIDGKEWIFTNELVDNQYDYINRFQRADKIVTAESAVFTGYENIVSGRGYIWSRTIPLLSDYMFLGSGADTFSIVFPHQDYVGSYNYGFSDSIMTKPHSMYFQIGVQTGVLSLIMFLVFYLMYFISCIHLYISGRFESYYSQVGVSVFIGSISYMICGISNDSTITVAPVFWVMIGVGIAMNSKVYLMKKQEKQ